jgi:hypothetical protein
MERLKSENIMNGFVTLDLRAGKYKGLLLRASGTNQAGQTALVTDLGKIKLQHQNFGERINTTFKFWADRTNALDGVAEADSVAAGAFAFTCVVSFRRLFDKTNVLVARSDLKTTLTWDSLTALLLSTKIASGTMEIYGLFDDTGAARYIPNVRTQQVSCPAAQFYKEHIPSPFVEEVWGVDDAQIDTVQVLRDGLVKVDGKWAALKALSNAINNVETAITLLGLVEPSGESPSNVGQTTIQFSTLAALTGNVFTYHYFVCEPLQG